VDYGRACARAARIATASVVALVIGALTVPAVAHAATPLGPRMGVTAGNKILWESNAERRADLDFIAASGAKWFGVDIDWPSIEPAWQHFNWGPTDRVVKDAKARGLKIVGTIAYSPSWNRPASCRDTHCFPARAYDFGQIAKRAAERYGNASPYASLRGAITTWQIWNEPNHYPFVQPPVSPVAYTELLRYAYVYIKSVDPFATVLAGGTAPAPDDPWLRDMSPVTFLKGIYAAGGQRYFDAFAHHPYSFPCSPLIEAPWNAFYQTAALYWTMAVNGDGHKKIWATESGAPTGTDRGSCSPGNTGMSVYESVQALYVQQYLWGWTVKYGAFTGPILWHQIRNNGTRLHVWDDNMGLLRRDFSAKPSFSTFSHAARYGL
jgi:hypothetical protein